MATRLRVAPGGEEEGRITIQHCHRHQTMSSSESWEKINISNSAKYIYTIVKCVSPHAANIFAAARCKCICRDKGGNWQSTAGCIGWHSGGRTGAELTFVLCRVSRHHVVISEWPGRYLLHFNIFQHLIGQFIAEI